MRHPILLLLSLVLPALVHAQSLSLEGAVAETGGQNPELKEKEADLDAADWRQLEALSGHLPHLGVHAEHFFNAKYEDLNVNLGGAPIVFPSAYPQTTATLEASVNLFDGFATLNRYRAAKMEFEAARLELEQKRFETEQNVRKLFYEALAAQILVEVSEQNIKSLDEHLALAKAQQNSGYATRFDSLRVEAQREEAQAERMLNIDNMTLARKALSRAMGLMNDPRPLQGSLPTPREALVPRDLSLDMEQRRDFQAQLRHEAAWAKQDAAAHGFWFPQISVFADQTYYKYGSFDPAVNSTQYQSAYAVGLRLNWELFDGGYSIARANGARALSEKAVQATRAQRLNADEDFERWKMRFVYNVALYHARSRLVEKSNESVRLAHLGLRAGTRTSSDALDAELELFKSRAGLVKANLESLEALLYLESAVGHRLEGAKGG